MSASEQVNVKVGDCFATIGTIVDYDTKSFFQIEFPGHVSSGEKQVAQ